MSFSTNSTRQLTAGDTPDLNDGVLSRLIVDALNLVRGQACYLVAGEITLAAEALSLTGAAPFVPVESVDNTNDGLEAAGVTAPQRVAVTIRGDTTDGTTFNPGDYLKVSDATSGVLAKWNNGDVDASKYARYLGIEAALFVRDGSTPFGETLSAGVVPDQTQTAADGVTFVAWVQLKENEDT